MENVDDRTCDVTSNHINIDAAAFLKYTRARVRQVCVILAHIEHEFRGRERVHERGQSFAQASDGSDQSVVEFEPLDHHAQRKSYT